jgi:hypothetical protein
MFQVNTSPYPFWSNEFDVIKPSTNKKGNRLYTQSDIENLKKIYHLVKEKGLPEGCQGGTEESCSQQRRAARSDSLHRPGSETSQSF